MTPGQLRVLGAIVDLFEDEGLGPTLREIATKLGLSSPAGICEHIAKLKAAGLVEWKPRKARTLYPTDAGWELACLPLRPQPPPAPPVNPARLVVDSLEARLEKCIPGAVLYERGPRGTLDAWRVLGPKGELLATAASGREAVDRAVFLWGRR